MKSSGTPKTMTIGQLAERFRLATHVLRHWESVGLLTPATRVSGRRLYHDEHIARVTLILRGKSAGLSLDQLREVLAAPNGVMRRKLLAEHHAELERRIRETAAAKELIEHALECSADDFTQCPAFRHLAEAGLGAVPIGMIAGPRG
ncbi:MerR family transcriptional regulator [Micromonospora sp. NPDC049230]|uniref:MerR family transcriptional regulator n=1 Tax=Micromonospora sp. NPDC049230 TaxID=3155502 RepID=UPI0033DB4964